MATPHPDTPRRPRWLPSSLRARMALAVLVTNLAVAGVVLLVLALFWRAELPRSEERVARDTVTHLLALISEGASSAELLTSSFADSDGAREVSMSDTPAPSDALERFDDHMSEAEAAAWVRADGSVLHFSGEREDVALLHRMVADRTGSTPLSGLMLLQGDELAYVTANAITGTSGGAPSGWLIAAVAVDLDSRLPHVEVDFQAGALDPGSTDRLTAIKVDGVGAVFSPGEDGEVIVKAEVEGVDGSPVGWFELVAPSPVRGQPTGLLAYAMLIALGSATIVGLLVGMALARTIGRPLEALTDRIHLDGHAALEGRPVRNILPDPRLPDEVRSVLEVFDRLLSHLERHRAELLGAEMAAEASALNLALAVNDSSEGKLLVRDDVLVVANPAAESLIGAEPGTLRGSPSSVLADLTYTGESGGGLTADEVLGLAIERPVSVRIERPDGSSRWAEVRTIEHDDPARTLLVTARDITEERRVRHLREEVISLVSHDLRAPLTVISGYLELLGRPLDEEQRSKAVASGLASAERMSALIDDILNATRAEELFAPVSLVPVEMSTLAEEIVSSLEHTSAHRLRSIAISPGLVPGEARRLRQALVNLVTNAINHTPEPGAITITVERSDGRVLISVEDEGPGIRPEDRERIFERFTRLEHDDEDPRGFGLGLYIVKAIVESHGGRIHVEDRAEGSGARFVISLPAATGF